MSVIVVGAGPVGLLTTLRLAQAGIATTCIDMLKGVDGSPRAMAYHPVATKELDRAGVLEDIRKRGGSSGSGICWRQTKTGEVIATLERGVNKDFPYENLVIGQNILAEIILEHFNRYDGCKVHFDRKVVAIDQTDNKATVTTQKRDGSNEVFEADYVVGADGGKSSVRKLIGVTFDGMSWPEELVACNVYYPFDKYGWQDGNFIW